MIANSRVENNPLTSHPLKFLKDIYNLVRANPAKQPDAHRQIIGLVLCIQLYRVSHSKIGRIRFSLPSSLTQHVITNVDAVDVETQLLIKRNETTSANRNVHNARSSREVFDKLPHETVFLMPLGLTLSLGVIACGYLAVVFKRSAIQGRCPA